MNKILIFPLVVGLSALPLMGEDKIVIKDGISYQQTFFDSGKLKTEVPVVKRQKQGLLYCWKENGKLRYIAPFYLGRIEGTLISFYEDGKIQKLSNFEKGIPEGYILNFYPSGQLKSICLCKNGLPGQLTVFKQDGSLLSIQPAEIDSIDDD